MKTDEKPWKSSIREVDHTYPDHVWLLDLNAQLVFAG